MLEILTTSSWFSCTACLCCRKRASRVHNQGVTTLWRRVRILSNLLSFDHDFRRAWRQCRCTCTRCSTHGLLLLLRMSMALTETVYFWHSRHDLVHETTFVRHDFRHLIRGRWLNTAVTVEHWRADVLVKAMGLYVNSKSSSCHDHFASSSLYLRASSLRRYSCLQVGSRLEGVYVWVIQSRVLDSATICVDQTDWLSLLLRGLCSHAMLLWLDDEVVNSSLLWRAETIRHIKFCLQLLPLLLLPLLLLQLLVLVLLVWATRHTLILRSLQYFDLIRFHRPHNKHSRLGALRVAELLQVRACPILCLIFFGRVGGRLSCVCSAVV